MDFIVEVLLAVVLSYPGAAIRWLLHRGKIPYKVLIQEDTWYNASYVFLVIVAVIVIQYVLKHD